MLLMLAIAELSCQQKQARNYLFSHETIGQMKIKKKRELMRMEGKFTKLKLFKLYHPKTPQILISMEVNKCF